MSDFRIRPYSYTKEDTAKLAVMWNESDDQWPGTFSEGVPFTAERVSEWMDRETGLAILVVDDPTQERIVGFGSLWEEQDKENLCYVALLNVHPVYQGRSLARRLLIQMIDQAVDLGYHQMDIGTWPGNLKSVPLYKKVGFFWVPDTNVHMENYIPLIRQLPAAGRYFQRHDWYTTFQRKLLQVEDDERHSAMKVYRYRWEEDGDILSVLIDREAKTVTGLETNDLVAYAELDEIKPAHGLPYSVRWRVVNKRHTPIQVTILASGDPGIQISQQSSFVLGGDKERVVVENEFFQLRCRSEGGRCTVWDKANDRAASSIREELGPPFVPSELWFRPYDLLLERGDGWVKAILSARSNNFPGLAFTKEIKLSASPLMTLHYRLTNKGAQTHTVQLNPRIWLGDRGKARFTYRAPSAWCTNGLSFFRAPTAMCPNNPKALLSVGWPGVCTTLRWVSFGVRR